MNEELGLDMVSIRLVTDNKIGTDKRIRYPQDAVLVVSDLIKDMDREFVCMINLKSNGVPANCSIVSIGMLNGSLIDVRELMKTSILSNSAGIILLHNHPSGSCNPTKEDIQISNKIQMACQLMDIRFYDHLIVASITGDLYSMRDNDIIESEKLKYSNNVNDVHFDNLLMDEADLKEKTLSNLIDNYFLTPDRKGVSYKDRLMEGCELLTSIVKELENCTKAEPELSQKILSVAQQEGILIETKNKEQTHTMKVAKTPIMMGKSR